MKIATDITLGCIYEEVVTGYTGCATGYCVYWTGCDQVLLIPTTLTKDGDKQDGHWIDINRVRLVTTKKPRALVLHESDHVVSGPDREAPKR